MASMFDASELVTLSRDFGKVPNRLRPLVSQVVRKTAYDVAATAKDKVPVDTGNLKNSIGVSGARSRGAAGGAEAEVTATSEYARYVEVGTSRMAAQPYMGPALDHHTPAFEAALAELVSRRLFGG